MLDRRITNLGTRADQHANHACRNAGFLEDARGQQAARHGVSLAGLITMALPRANAGATERWVSGAGSSMG